MENENLTEQELLRLKSVALWRSRSQELFNENRALRKENQRLQAERDALAFEAITNQINDTDWSGK